MITEKELSYLDILMDLAVCLEQNDTALAEEVRDKINAMEADDSLTNTINDSLTVISLMNLRGSAESCRIIIEGVEVVRNKEYKLTVLDAASVMNSGNAKSIGAWLEGNYQRLFDLTVDENQFVFFSWLIRMCAVAKRYDIMEMIRAALKEGK